MSNFIQQIEAALLPTANQYVPEGSELKVIAHQFDRVSHTLENDKFLTGKT